MDRIRLCDPLTEPPSSQQLADFSSVPLKEKRKHFCSSRFTLGPRHSANLTLRPWIEHMHSEFFISLFQTDRIWPGHNAFFSPPSSFHTAPSLKAYRSVAKSRRVIDTQSSMLVWEFDVSRPVLPTTKKSFCVMFLIKTWLWKGRKEEAEKHPGWVNATRSASIGKYLTLG